jgi:hypothetical protein
LAVALLGKTRGGVPRPLFVLCLIKTQGRVSRGKRFAKAHYNPVAEYPENTLDEFYFFSVGFDVLIIQKAQGGLAHG